MCNCELEIKAPNSKQACIFLHPYIYTYIRGLEERQVHGEQHDHLGEGSLEGAAGTVEGSAGLTGPLGQGLVGLKVCAYV
jgi:hypothetical protein